MRIFARIEAETTTIVCCGTDGALWWGMADYTPGSIWWVGGGAFAWESDGG